MVKDSEIFEHAAELVENGFAKDVFALDKNGDTTLWFDNDAVSFCVRGAILRSYLDLKYVRLNDSCPTHLEYFVASVLGLDPIDRRTCYHSLAIWNNKPERTKNQVVTLLKKCSELKRINEIKEQTP